MWNSAASFWDAHCRTLTSHSWRWHWSYCTLFSKSGAYSVCGRKHLEGQTTSLHWNSCPVRALSGTRLGVLSGRHRVCIISLGRLLPQTFGCGHFSLPKELTSKQCLINVSEGLHKCEWDVCFVFAVLAVLHPAKGAYRRRAYSYREHKCRYVFPKTFLVTFPQDVDTFERKNGASVNVFGYNSEIKFIYPLKVLIEEFEQHVDLLLIENHFVGVTNFARLFFQMPIGYAFAARGVWLGLENKNLCRSISRCVGTRGRAKPSSRARVRN